MSYEVHLKKGGGDTSRSSLVFRCSKDDEAYDRPLLRHIRNTKLNFNLSQLNSIKQKCLSVLNDQGHYTVTSRS